MKRLLNFLVLILSTIIMSCAGPYSIEDSGTTVNLSTDDVFEIDLVGNASTGYNWQILECDSTVVKQFGDVNYKPSNDKIGSAGTYTYKFKTVANGATNLVLVYKRKWEESNPMDKTFQMKVVVGTMGRILDE